MARKPTSGKRSRRDSSQTTDLERSVGDEQVAAGKVPSLNSRVDLLVLSFRVRLCDPDGVSAKAAIDGCVQRGLLRDDSTKFIREVRQQQVKVKNQSEEKTLLIFTPIEEEK